MTASETTQAIPQDPNAGGFDSPERLFVMRGGTLGGEGEAPIAPTTPAIVSGSYAGDSETVITVTFTVDGSGPLCLTTGQNSGTCSVVLWFGAHVATQADWGLGQGAGGISGSPYHVALDAFDGASVGQRDNQMQANAVTADPNGTIVIVKDAVPDDAQDFSFNLNNNGTINQNFTLDDDADVTLSSTRTFSVPPGTWSAAELGPLPAGWSLANLVCVDPTSNTTVNVATGVATINLASSETVTCTYTNTKDLCLNVTCEDNNPCTLNSCNPASGCFYPAGNSGTECRASAGVCDLAESCTGLSAACPADAKEPATTECRASAGVCDVAESCNGTSNDCPADGFASATTECRGEVGLCDVAESCTGSAKECPADAYELAGVACGDAGDTVCDNADTCKGGENTCLPNWEPATTECRGEVGLCDVAESCTGSAKECPADAYELAGVACGDAGDTVCDNADTCKGGENTCLPNWEPATTECRGEVGLCDVAESCTGSAKECPADAYELAGVACGDAGDTVCDNADTCKGGENTCLPNWEPATTECRGEVGLCDVAESCTGSAKECPADAYELAGVACGDAGDTVCDNADTCKGGENTCLPNWEPATTECRGEVGLCDVAESCTGSAKECPADAYELAGVACGDAGDTVCDNADTCKGGENTCLPNWEPATTECRGEVGLCDVAESCTGSAKECPADAYELAGVACGDAGDTVCDNADTCKGGENTCLPNWEPATTECRGEVGLCDVAESCTGSAKECPADAYELAGVACGDAGDTVCDNADTCKGGENTCLPNWEPATTECRGEVGLCDVAESCTGSAKECPADAYELAGVACGDAGDTVCDNADTCKGGENTCLPNWEPATTECRGEVGLCDVAESCTGSAKECPADALRVGGRGVR